MTDGLVEASQTAKPHQPHYDTNLVRQKLERTLDFKQAGDTYRAFEDWERNDLINNLVGALIQCDIRIQDKMVEYFTNADEDYGRRVREGLEQEKRDSDATARERAVEGAEQMGHEADPY